MKISSIQEIKAELDSIPPKELKQLCLKLARFKKENKELLTYILFESHNPAGYVEEIRSEIDEAFTELPKSNMHLTTKSLRKQLRMISKYNRLMSSPEAHVEVLLHFCKVLSESKIPMHRSTAITNLYQAQLKKIRVAITGLHEDLQFEYLKALEKQEQVKQEGRSIFGLRFKI